jgi:hypothetical protein
LTAKGERQNRTPVRIVKRLLIEVCGQFFSLFEIPLGYMGFRFVESWYQIAGRNR